MRPWSAKDVIGTWRYTSSTSVVVTITFKSDGTFDQSGIFGTRGLLKQQGSWSIAGRALILDDVLMNVRDNQWEPLQITWNVVDSKLRPGGLAVSGGADPDPDVFAEFTKVTPTSKPH
jgi:hypothetical protein